MALEPVAAPAIELSGADRFARVVDQCHEEMYLVQREESKSAGLVARHEVPDTCPRQPSAVACRENAGAYGAGDGLAVELEARGLA